MLLIQKVVKLLDDFHFQVFRNHVKNKSIRSYYPLALIDVIDRDGFKSRSIEALCRDVYTEYDEATHKKFLQLAHYTFKLTAFLAKNYPDYLNHNLSKIQHLINSGFLEKGIFLLDLTIEMSAKVEDRPTELSAQQILAQHHVLTEKRDVAIKCFHRITWLQAQQKQQLDILTYLHTHHALRSSDTVSKDHLEEHLVFFEQYKDSESFYVRFLQQCGTFFFMHLSRDRRFYTKETYGKILECEKEYERHDYVVTPFLSNYVHVLQFLKLHHFIQVAAQEEVSKLIPKLLAENNDLLFWESYFNITEFSALIILTNFYSKNYFLSYRKDHIKEIPKEVQQSFGVLKERCEKILAKPNLEEKFIIRYINLSTIYALLLSCGDEADIKKSIRILEGLLINYQQIPFYGLADSIYTILTLGYFCLEDFDNVDKCFRRFKKNLKNKTITADNDFIIQSIFYISKWRATQRNQYLKKLEQLFDDPIFLEIETSKNQIVEIIKYFDIPITHSLEKNKTKESGTD